MLCLCLEYRDSSGDRECDAGIPQERACGSFAVGRRWGVMRFFSPVVCRLETANDGEDADGVASVVDACDYATASCWMSST